MDWTLDWLSAGHLSHLDSEPKDGSILLSFSMLLSLAFFKKAKKPPKTHPKRNKAKNVLLDNTVV